MSGAPVVLVTGASRGIGAGAARALAARGARLALCARSGQDLEALAAELSTPVLVQALDLADLEATRAFARRVLDHFGRLDGLVNNAARVGPVGPTAEVDLDSWRRSVDLNLMAPLVLARETLPALRASRGRLVQVSTGAATQPLPHFGAYCATKAALTHLARVLAVEEPEVVSLCFSPGVVDTGMQGEIRGAADRIPEPYRSFFLDLPRRGMLTRPETAGQVLAWLALEAPREWSGQVVDGDDPQVRLRAERRAGGD